MFDDDDNGDEKKDAEKPDSLCSPRDVCSFLISFGALIDNQTLSKLTRNWARGF